jgi:hypothetical protein
MEKGSHYRIDEYDLDPRGGDLYTHLRGCKVTVRNVKTGETGSFDLSQPENADLAANITKSILRQEDEGIDGPDEF